MKKYLIIMQQDPYKNSLAMEGLEFAIALSAFNQSVAILFKDDGIIQLLKKQDPEKLVCKDFTKIYHGIHLFGIEEFYIDYASLQSYQLTELMLQPKIITTEEFIELKTKYDIIMTI